jgi:hypothetical protein
MQVVVECEVIPSSIYGCVTGEPPYRIDVCDKVGKFSDLLHLLWLGDCASWKRGNVLFQQGYLKNV